MAEEGSEAEERLDELYRGHPEEFVAARNELARELRAAGDRDAAEQIKKLRRPSSAAWLINLTALSSPEPLEEFADASRRLEEAQARALEGDEGAVDGWRAGAAREREASGAVVEAAASLARADGHPAGGRALELVGETLQAAAGDADLRDRVLRGRLEREQAATTLGTPAAAPARRRRSSGSAKRREASLARREVERLTEELEDAAAREERLRESVDRMTETLRDERARLAEAKRETASLRRQVKAAERKAR